MNATSFSHLNNFHSSSTRTSSRNQHQQSWAFDPKGLGTATQRFLRARHPQKTAANVVTATNGLVKESQVEKWLEGTSAPSGSALVALIGSYGPEFLSSLFRTVPKWLDQANRAERMAAIEAEISRQEAELNALKSSMKGAQHGRG